MRALNQVDLSMRSRSQQQTRPTALASSAAAIRQPPAEWRSRTENVCDLLPTGRRLERARQMLIGRPV